MPLGYDSIPYGWSSTAATCAHAYLLPALLRALPPAPQRVVDIGCGNGYLAGVLAARGYRVAGSDWSADGVELARAKHPGVEFHVASAYDDLSVVIGSDADIVVSTEVIEHLLEPRKLLRNAWKLLRPGGVLILSTPYHGYWKNLALALSGKLDAHFCVGWDGGHVKFFSVKTLSAMVREAGFIEVDFRFAGRVPYLWKSMLVRASKPRA